MATHWHSTVLVSLALSLGPSAASAQAPAPAPVPKTQTVVFDLLGPAQQMASVVEGRPWEVVLRNYAPTGLYRLTELEPSGARSRELRLPSLAWVLENDTLPCRALVPGIRAILEADDEATAAARIEALPADAKKQAPEPHCEAFNQSMLTSAAALSEYSLGSRTQLRESFRVRIERLSRVNRLPLMTWDLAVTPAQPKTPWKYPNEQAWIVHDTATRVIALAAAAAGVESRTEDDVVIGQRPASADVPRWTIAARLGARKLSVEVVSHPYVWAPEAFVELAKIALSPGRAPQTADAPSDLLARLTEPTVTVIEAENQRISRALVDRPGSAQLHEEAALLLGALALREQAGRFNDTRPFLNRATAHLALARALDGGRKPSREGMVAELCLLTIAGRQQDVMDRLAGTQDEAAVPLAWARALTLRITGDWRPCAGKDASTLLEKRECFGAFKRSLGGLAALEYLQEQAPPAVPDWGRIALAGGASVEEGNVLAEQTLMAELAEVAAVYPDWRPPTWPPTAKVDAEGSARAIAVIGAEAWHGVFERHILNAVFSLNHHNAKVLGLPEEAKSIQTELAPKFASFRLYPGLVRALATSEPEKPLAERDLAAEAARDSTCAAARDAIQKAPESWTLAVWQDLEDGCRALFYDEVSLPSRTWFNQLFPAGTVYDGARRVDVLDHSTRLEATNWDALRRLAPYEKPVISFFGGRTYRRSLNAEEFDSLYGAFRDYDLAVMKRSAELMESRGSAYLERLEKICALDPDSYFALGSTLAELGRSAEAAVAYQKAVDNARDRVGASNGVDWLVDYYYEHGQGQRALEIAQGAAETYSGGGLITLARLYERMGRFEDAREYYSRAQTRYPKVQTLDRFYIRCLHRHGGKRFKQEGEEAVRKLFKNGLVRTTRAELDAAHGSGGPPASFVGHYVTTSEGSLHVGDRVVALDGYRIDDSEQFYAVRSLSDSPVASLVVLRKGAFQEVESRLSRAKYSPAK